MKKETIITAAVFLAVGFLAGYAYNGMRSSTLERADVVPSASGQASEPAAAPGADSSGAAAEASSGAAGAADPQGLPPGHPPIDSSSAIKMLEGEAAAQPDNPKPRLELANFFYDHKQFEQAIPWYQNALELDPNNVNARTDLGTAYYSLGRADEAARQYRKSLEVDPSHQPTLYNLALVSLEGTHDVAAARDAYTRLKKLNPSYPGLDSLQQAMDSAGGSKTPRK